jgi:hypothetical protein
MSQRPATRRLDDDHRPSGQYDLVALNYLRDLPSYTRVRGNYAPVIRGRPPEVRVRIGSERIGGHSPQDAKEPRQSLE